MIANLLGWLRTGFPPTWVTAAAGAMPILEVRGAIPLGVALGLSFQKAYLWGCLGNLIPIAPLLLFLDPVSAWLRRFPIWKRFFDWAFAQTASRADVVQRYEAIGLAIFVAIPLPLTGAWSGCIAASLFKLPFRVAFPAISAGVLMAGGLVSLALKLGLTLFYAIPR